MMWSSYNFLLQHSDFKTFQDSFYDEKSLTVLLTLLAIITVVCLAVILWQKIAGIEKKHYEHFSNAHRLFEDILVALELTDEEQKLLRQMTTQARLKQPAIALLSPQLLEDSCQLWIKEKGTGSANNEKLQKLSAISEKIFGQIEKARLHESPVSH